MPDRYREGLADACILIFAGRGVVGTLDDVGDAANVTRIELQRAAERFQEKARARQRALLVQPAQPIVAEPKPVRRIARVERECSDCGAVYGTGQGMAAHRRSVHGGDPVPCPVCGRRFQPAGLAVHVARMHKEAA